MAEPSYMKLYRSGELEERAEALLARLGACDICPRECGVDRLSGETGFCRTGRLPAVSSACVHHGEEPAISGSRGSGTIFFANCNLHCVYCQNYQISQEYEQCGDGVTDEALAGYMLALQNKSGCHNINLVTPSHVVPRILEALAIAVPEGLHIPLVYNTSSYDNIETIKMLDGIVDIYLADLRYGSDDYAAQYSQAPDYVPVSRKALKEMYRQVGDVTLDDDGIALRGLIIRHLILPNGIAGSEESLTWLAEEVSPNVTVSIMAQYYPAYLAPGIPELGRTITRREYDNVLGLLDRLGMENGWIQELAAANNYLPDFGHREHPFHPASG